MKATEAKLLEFLNLTALRKGIAKLVVVDMEVAFWQEAYGTHFDSFMRHYR